MPYTPRHSPHPSFDSEGRRSKSSLHDPTTPVLNSFGGQSDMMMMDGTGSRTGGDVGDVGDGNGDGTGLGNLADELADAFDDDDDDEYYEHDGEAPPDISIDEGVDSGDAQSGGKEGEAAAAARDSGVDVESQTGSGGGNNSGSGGGGGGGVGHAKTASAGLTLPTPDGRGHRRAASDYDGSEYGSESDLDSPGMSSSLVATIDAVESLARRGTGSTGSATDATFKRVTEGLRDLGSQSGVEGSASRLITAHSALTTHLSHQTRQLHNLTFPLLSPLVPPPDADTVDGLLPTLAALSETMPRPSTGALASLGALHALTADLVQTLDYLSDTLQVSRQATTTAARRLRGAKELVAELRRDEELREEGERWLTRGNWGDRLAHRECAHVCGEVVGGFEEVCNGWRARLLAQAESAKA